MRSVAATFLALCCALVPALRAQSSAATLRGTWAATAPSRAFQGSWTARIDGPDPNTAQGTFTLFDRSNRPAAQGTWSAVKNANGWSGSWQARVAGNRRLFGGTWRTDLPKSDVKTFRDLLQRTLQEQVSGVWVSAGLRGAWSLRAFP